MTEAINTAFAGDVRLRKRIFDAINETPQHAPLFEDIAKYQLSNLHVTISNDTQNGISEQPSKKRKLADGAASVNGSLEQQPRTVILEARDISFSLPQRKKLHLSIVQYGQDFHAPTTTFTLCARNPATSQVEFEFPTTLFAYALRVPVPEKAQKQYNFCLLPSSQPQSADSSFAVGDGVIWTVNYGPLKSCQINSPELQQIAPGPDDILENTLDAVLRRHNNQLVYPTEAEFTKAIAEAHRKNDKAYHVKAFRGSKDGYLFFLENGIFFGFKKPIAFYPFHEIESVSYTAVLQRTFNLIVVVRQGPDAQEQEIEFSMLDQTDFAGIDAYIKRHQLQDASMAETRRAKKFNVNGNKGEAAREGEIDGRTELEKAEEEMVDEEDELEEDYDPGSDGESGGSGSSDEDEDYEYTNDANSKDIVKDELGSEAEDVDISEAEGEDEEEEEEDEDNEEDKAEGHEQLTTHNKKPVATAVSATPGSQSIPPPHPHARYGGPDIDDADQL